MKTRAKKVFLLLSLPALAAFAACLAYLLWLPDVRPLKSANPETTAYIELRRRQAKRQGEELAVKWEWAPWDRISEHLKNAVFIAEDDMFWRHRGVDWENLRLALEKNWDQRRLAYGASTITQQTARNLYLSPSKNPLRKLKEALIARALEDHLGKRRIFEIYLNIAEWGKGVFGAEAAAQAYFAKSAADLEPEEAAALAAVLPKPLRLNPARETKYVVRNRERILRRMRASGMLLEEAEETLEEDFIIPASTPTSVDVDVPALKENEDEPTEELY